MLMELWIQYIAIFIAIAALVVDRKGMKRFIPVGMFASLYANFWCYLVKPLQWWNFPVRIFSGIEDISFTANVIIVPILAMFWTRYSPITRIRWTILWTTTLTGIEFLAEKYTNLIKYHNGYNWYHSYISWLVSWFIWYNFHKWFYSDEEEPLKK